MAYINGKNVFFSPKIHLTSDVNKKPYIDTSKMTNFAYFCYMGRNWELINQLDTSNGKYFMNMFANNFTSPAEEYPEAVDTSNGINLSYMFHCADCLEVAPRIDTSKAENVAYLFCDCACLKTIPQALDFSNLKSKPKYAFENCTWLENVAFVEETIDFSISFAHCKKLSRDSLTSIINGLSFATKTFTLTLNSTTIELLTKEDYEIIANKGWTVG